MKTPPADCMPYRKTDVLTSQCFPGRCDENGIEIRYIQAGKPDQNAYMEGFNRS